MDPPTMMNDGSFNFGQIWQFPMNGSGRDRFGQGLDQFGDLNREFEVGLEQRVNHGAKKRRDLDDDSGNGVSSRSFHGNCKNDCSEKRAKTTGSKGGNQNSKPETEPSSGKHVEENNRTPKPPKQDYIHVRARRGQATDSHSLAERARREKISERMKILQDLVPGCNKVIGKALVLDEIINYIQSLQRQVEFLSMKLEAVNSRMNPVLEVFPAKEFGQQVFDISTMAYGSQPAREYNRGLSPEWLHMQVGGGGDGGFERTS